MRLEPRISPPEVRTMITYTLVVQLPSSTVKITGTDLQTLLYEADLRFEDVKEKITLEKWKVDSVGDKRLVVAVTVYDKKCA